MFPALQVSVTVVSLSMWSPYRFLGAGGVSYIFMDYNGGMMVDPVLIKSRPETLCSDSPVCDIYID